MKEFTIDYIKELIHIFEENVKKNIFRKKYNRVVGYLKAISYLRYKFYLGYRNDFVEGNLEYLSRQLDNPKLGRIYKNRVVFVDNICADPIGLTQQYLDALIGLGYELLYIYTNEFPSQVCTKIIQSLKEYDKAIIRKIPEEKKGLGLSQWLLDEVNNFGASKLFAHLTEWSIEECIAFYALPKSITRYRICLADHTYWTGSGCLDYIFEFRHFGCNLSLKERNLKKKQIIYLPFYPIMKERDFQGFPEEAQGMIKILSGGSVYKIVDAEDTYFKLCKKLLDNCPQAVILFAGGTYNDKVIADAISHYELRDKFIPIGYRKDIVEIFENCDIYLNTYPIGGGLMCQYAANSSKPIISYKIHKGFEECIEQKSKCKFNYDNLEDLLHEAHNLCSEAVYRKKRGQEIKDAVISHKDFLSGFKDALQDKKTKYQIYWKKEIDRSGFKTQDAIDYNNKNSLVQFYYKLNKMIGIHLFLISPESYISLYTYRIKRKIMSIIK